MRPSLSHHADSSSRAVTTPVSLKEATPEALVLGLGLAPNPDRDLDMDLDEDLDLDLDPASVPASVSSTGTLLLFSSCA